jgi:hypothetical protein
MNQSEHTQYGACAKFYHYTVVTVFRIMWELDTTINTALVQLTHSSTFPHTLVFQCERSVNADLV